VPSHCLAGSLAVALMNEQKVESWGRIPRLSHLGVHHLRFRDAPFPELDSSALAFGNGRSYGDSCLNGGGYLLSTRGLDHFMEFDPKEGRVRCESGVLLRDVLKLIVNENWFLPVTPGTQYVTVGGAIANDVHGKNHHVSGSFGHHLNCFELLRSNGERLLCSPDSNPDLFHASIGGLGLTGVITWAEFRLKPISNSQIKVDTLRFDCLDDFFTLAEESDQEFEYTVAWIDCLASGTDLGRGMFMRGNHADALAGRKTVSPSRQLSVPLDPPFSLIGNASLKIFNSLYYHKQLSKKRTVLQNYEPFFYPLDGVLEWNRIYGPKGLFQFQSVVPMEDAPEVTRAMLELISRSGQGSFLSVLKLFGAQESIGMLSFPRPGATLALDFPNRGVKTRELLQRLEALVIEAGGAIYPAKDACMSQKAFAVGFPRAGEFTKYIDPGCSSSFWRRVMEEVA
jgi:FAD/FMN-containing dehydrogenase